MLGMLAHLEMFGTQFLSALLLRDCLCTFVFLRLGSKTDGCVTIFASACCTLTCCLLLMAILLHMAHPGHSTEEPGHNAQHTIIFGLYKHVTFEMRPCDGLNCWRLNVRLLGALQRPTPLDVGICC